MKSAKSFYEVWALGYDKDDMCTDIEKLLGTFKDEQDAVHCAEQYTKVSDVKVDEDEQLVNGDYLEIRVEKCIEHKDYVESTDIVYSNFIY